MSMHATITNDLTFELSGGKWGGGGRKLSSVAGAVLLPTSLIRSPSNPALQLQGVLIYAEGLIKYV